MDLIKKQPEVYNLVLTILNALRKDHSRYQPKIFGLDINQVFQRLHDEPEYIMSDINRWLPKLNHIKLNVNDWNRFDITYSDEIENVWLSQNEGNKNDIGYLYHGSAMRNWYSILRNGIKVCSGTKWMSAGAAYGSGIYLSDAISLSYGYSEQTGDSIIGVYEIYNLNKYKKANNVYVVPQNDKILLRHLLFLPEKSHSLSTMNMMQTTMQEYWKSRILVKKDTISRDEKIMRRRMEMEIKLFIDGVTWNSNTRILVYQDFIVEIPPTFPFSSPIIYKQGIRIFKEWSPDMRLINLFS